jgi:hypothetical protein
MVNVTLHPPGGPATTQSAPLAAQAAPSSAVETPTQRVVQAGNRNLVISDENGRQILWRRLNALEDFDLTEIAGTNATNQEWMMRATIAFGVREIDGDPVARPNNKLQLRALVGRLDNAGMQAILNAVAEEAEAQAAISEEAERAKN